MEADTSPAPEVLFRPVKRQKHLRKRADQPSELLSPGPDTAQPSAQTTEPPSGSQIPADDNDVEISSILRQRRPHRPRRGGIEFSAETKPKGPGSATEMESEKTEADIIQERLDRFTPHTDLKVDVNKHMMEYIETELAKRQNRKLAEQNAGRAAGSDQTQTAADTQQLPLREPATLGKLHEVDLGQEAKLQNIARTQEATARLAGKRSPSPEKRPVDSRGRHRRRTSADIERDRLVEEVLRESKLDVYDEPEPEPEQDDQAADDRIAEQFRRDFLEAIQTRRRMARSRAARNQGQADTRRRGPKLGGSRSLRAAYREQQVKATQK
ncbi:hypothetical protein VTN31DRAFT_2690 [Thermomyces dupontii]|uniref:uncharacterized protein n=1 Tax=Talaromyces thermophilus TaxID=28565 RepID=UPI0037431D1B